MQVRVQAEGSMRAKAGSSEGLRVAQGTGEARWGREGCNDTKLGLSAAIPQGVPKGINGKRNGGGASGDRRS